MQILSIDESLSAKIKWLVKDVYQEHKTLILRIKDIEKQLKTDIEASPLGKILLSIPGIGYINASAFVSIVASIALMI